MAAGTQDSYGKLIGRIVRQVRHVQQPVGLPAALAYIPGGFQDRQPELGPTRVVKLAILQPNCHLTVAEPGAIGLYLDSTFFAREEPVDRAMKARPLNRKTAFRVQTKFPTLSLPTSVRGLPPPVSRA